MLDVSPNASAYEIGRAHREVLALYDENALASYSFFDTDERVKILERVGEAYAVLSDRKRRAEYDRSLGISSDPYAFPAAVRKPGQAARAGGPGSTENTLREKVRRGRVNGDARRLAARLGGAGQVTGHDLKLLRRAIGLSVEEIEAGSDLGAGLIPALEEDHFEDLPSWLNLRSSLFRYAQLLQLDAEKIVSGYLSWFSEQV